MLKQIWIVKLVLNNFATINFCKVYVAYHLFWLLVTYYDVPTEIGLSS